MGQTVNENPVFTGEILSWYVDAGVDIALTDRPIDRFQQAKTPVVAPSATRAPTGADRSRQQLEKPDDRRGSTANPAIPVARDELHRVVPDAGAVSRAGTLARAAGSLEELRASIEGFEGCNLKFTARSTVFADGNPQAKLMLIGEAPDGDEDEQGLPFVGKSGQLLDKMLAAISLDRKQVYISNILPWRPPGNRAPTAAETEICRPFMERHIQLVKPDLLILFGGSSAKTLLQSKSGIMSLRGKWQKVTVAEREIPAMPCLHPAYLLRTPNHKGLAWKDLLAVKAHLTRLTDS
jgi:uracil-DNA glycosylase family 4